ncbi:MAG: fused MFS/spermidine synthase [Acidobacteriia bacterium]|nr:fused MFS/spermidine synthase [Terriglobia bacterium]
MTQTILLREFLSVFSGNELVIGIVLASWMVLTGLGAFLGKFLCRTSHPASWIVPLLCMNALLPLATVFALDTLRNEVFPIGSMIGIVQCLYSSALLLAPYCLVAGSLFTLCAAVISQLGQANLISRVYTLEAVGSIAGGLLFNLILVFFVSTYHSLILLAGVNLGVCFWIAQGGRKWVSRALITLVALSVISPAVFVNLDRFSKQRLFPHQNIAVFKDTPYGNLAITEQGGQQNVYENSTLLFSTNDSTGNEEAVHYAMIQHPNPKRVLMVSGGISGMAREILKYNVDRIDYVELNPWIIRLGRYLATDLENPKIHVFTMDARRFVRQTQASYDVVLMNIPDPATAQVNRYFTAEFLDQLRAKLAPGAVVSFSLVSSGDYLGPEARQVSSVVYNTLQYAFRNVLIVPGLRNFFLASDREMSIHMAQLIRARGIDTVYVNSYYLDDSSLEQRSDSIRQVLNSEAPINRDFRPIAYYRQLIFWLSSLKFRPWMLVTILVLMLAAVGWRFNTINLGLFTGGFAASSMELLLLVAFQIIYGFVYQAMGIVITIFMAGLALGSWLGRKWTRIRNAGGFIAAQILVTVYALALPQILSWLKGSSIDSFVYTVFVILTLAIAVLVGLEFSVASELRQGSVESVTSELYSMDLMGSAMGALIVSIFLLPLWGVARTCGVVALLNLASCGVAVVNRKKIKTSVQRGLAYV